MDTDDRDLAERLTALEAALPAPDRRPAPPGRTRRPRFALSFGLAPAALLVIVATATAGAAVVAGGLVRGHPGIENPGQPLAGATMECMTPPEAAAFLAAHGFTDVVWQVESGDPSKGGGKGETSSAQQSVAPLHGFVIPGSLLDDGSVIMVVDQRVGATGVGACVAAPMP